MKKRLGIVGGMGPQATVYMFNKIVELSPAGKDQDHIEIFIHNNTKIPDRTRAILYGGESPLEELVRSARILKQMGADVLIIPCMTSHHYFDALQSRVSIPIINAVERTVFHISDKYLEVERVGILATTGTIKSRLFQDCLVRHAHTPIVLPDDLQENLVMPAIYGEKGVKSGLWDSDTKETLRKAAEHLSGEGAESIIAGCTEIPLALEKSDVEIPLIDPMEILAETAIQTCLGEPCDQ